MYLWPQTVLSPLQYLCYLYSLMFYIATICCVATDRLMQSQWAECIKQSQDTETDSLLSMSDCVMTVSLTEAVRVERLRLTRLPVIHLGVFLLIFVRIVRGVRGPEGTGRGVRHVSHGWERIGHRQLLLCVWSFHRVNTHTSVYAYMGNTDKLSSSGLAQCHKN